MSAETLSEPHFTPDDLPLSLEKLQERETWQMEVGNWRGDHTVPSVGEHYRYLWKWDSYKAVFINARRGRPDMAELEMRTMEDHRDPHTGFLPNKVFATADHKTWRDYPEAWTFNNNRVGSSYTQPPIAAWAAMETYLGFQKKGQEAQGRAFLQSIYGTAEEGNYTGLQGEYAYFINHRQNRANDPLIGIVHPNETGRDSDEANKPWLLAADGKVNTLHEWAHMQVLGHKLGGLGRDPEGKRIDWLPEQVRKKYWVNDVMFNSMYASNLRYLADIADLLSGDTSSHHKKHQYMRDGAKYRQVAGRVESEILSRMWDEEQGFFYNLDKDGNHIRVDSITGLFPLMLEGISEEQISALLDKLEDPEWFATPFPIPSHAVRSPFFNPESARGLRTLIPDWSGKVWISPNVLIVEEGIVPLAEALMRPGSSESSYRLGGRALKVGGHIVPKTVELLAINLKSQEFYGAITGRGMRILDFMWSNTGLHHEKYREAAQSYELPEKIA